MSGIEKIQDQIKTKELCLNLGCGPLRKPGYVGIDISPSPNTDFQCDVLEFIEKLPDDCVKAVYSRMFFEHLSVEQLNKLIHEVNRVLVDGGVLEVTVPHFSNPYQHSDPTHRSSFAVHSFDYFCEETPHFRKVPSYCRIKGWVLQRAKVRFVPFFRRSFGIPIPSFCDILNIVVNTSPILIELYERYLSTLFSIYEVTFFVKKA